MPRHPRQVHLRILGTTDLHVHILPFDYTADRRNETVGLARIADLASALRREVPNCLLFDNGDFLQGSPLGDLVAQRGLREGDVHPMIAAMNAAGYDAAGLGNHEFSHGLPFLRRSLQDARFPVVSANAIAADRPLGPPWVLLDREVRDGAGTPHPLRIGVISFLPPKTEVWDREHVAGRLHTPDMLAAAARHLPDLRSAGADLVVALCHSGIGRTAATQRDDHSATDIAARPEVDVVVAGHTHLAFPGPAHAGFPGTDAVLGTLCGKPAVMAGAFGSHLGVIDLLLDGSDGGGWRIAAAQSRALSVAGQKDGLKDGLKDGPARRPSAAGRRLRAAAGPAHQATRAALREPLGRTTLPVDTHFALAGDGPASFYIATAKRDHVRAAFAGTPLAGLPLLATASPFKSGGRGGPGNFVCLPAGPLTLRHIADLYPFPDSVAALRMTGARLCDWLERAASLFRTLRPGIPDQPLIDPEVSVFQFFGLLGASYTIDTAAQPRFGPDGRRNPAAGRLRDLLIDGAPLDPSAEVVVATSSYRAGLFLADGGEGEGSDLPLAAPKACRDILAAWVRRHGTLPPPPPPAWRLLLPPGASATLDTAPQAQPARAGLPGLVAEGLGFTADGFLRVRLTASA